MNKLLPTLACCVVAACAASAAQATVITFNNPGVIDISASNVATYTESGYTISGPSASFLTLDAALVGGFDSTPFSLKSVSGAVLTLLSLDAAFYNLGSGAGTLSVVGLVGGTQVAAQSINLGPATTVAFGSSWRNLSEVRFSGSTGFSLDNISAVPEPGRWALAAIGLVGLFMNARRRPVRG